MAERVRVTKASPERWTRAAARAIAEGVQVRQVNANGMWTANSGTDPKIAYLLEVNQGIAVSCSCPAGEFGDEVCKHRAAYYILAGTLDAPEAA